MRTIEMREMMQGSEFTNVRACLDNGGLVCLPCRSNYRILADLTNPKAVNDLLRSKHRTSRAPSLVFIPNCKALKKIAIHIPQEAKILAEKLWPGELTIRFEPNPDTIPSVILKTLPKAGGKIGVRIPSEPWILKLLEALDRPLLVSSANRERKHGATSPAMIRKNFMAYIDIFVNAGDIPKATSSTVVDFKNGQYHIKREGSISKSKIDAALNAE